MKKYYEILEVSPNASTEIIERAYRVLIKKYHPDLYVGEDRIYAEQKIKEINEAYKILSDDFLREQYNSELNKNAYDDFAENKNYVQKEKINKRKRLFKRDDNDKNKESKKNTIGTYRGVLDVTKIVFKNRPKLKSFKEFQREDYMAAGITAGIVIVLFIVLWFIPSTNGFIKSLIPFLN